MAHFSPIETGKVVNDPAVYRQRDGLLPTIQPDGWLKLHLPGDPVGIALDPVVAAIWSAAEGRTAVEIARAAQVSTHLAACTLAVLQRAGLLSGGTPPGRRGRPCVAQASGSRCRPTPQELSYAVAGELPDSRVPPASTTAVAAILLHHHSQADLESCLASVREQEEMSPAQITVLATPPVPPESPPSRLIPCQADTLLPTLAGELDRAAAEAILLLDSQFYLEPGCLTGLAQTLAMRGSIGAVALRLMWRQWPAFVIGIGLWPCNPYIGHLDVGQFEQNWQPVPAVSLAAGLFRREALVRVGLPTGEEDLDHAGAEWCRRARRQGYRFLAAHQAVACGPWPAPTTADSEPQSQPPRRRKQPPAWQPPGPGPMVHDGSPALTLDNVRGVYSHSPAISPLPIRRQIALLAEESPCHQAMLRELEAVGQVHRLPLDGDEELLLEGCGAADLVIATAEALDRCEFLEDWPRPLLLLGNGSPEPWLDMVDGLVCDGGRQVQSRLGRSEPLAHFCRQPRLDPEREIDLVLGPGALQGPPPPTPLRQLPVRAWHLLSQQGVKATMSEMARYLRWKLGV